MANSYHLCKGLLRLLEENNGKLGNINARRLLSEKSGREIDLELYEQVKERLLSDGLIKRAGGKGGAIQMLPPESSKSSPAIAITTQELISAKQRADSLFDSLNVKPGMRVRRNRSSLTLLCGDDNDKLFCGWDEGKEAYYVQYRSESGREDKSDLVVDLFGQSASDVPSAFVREVSSCVTLYAGNNLSRFTRVIGRLKDSLEDVSLDNAPQRAGGQRRPRQEDYYIEISRLIKFCVDNSLSWPLKNWRRTLGFDDVDDLIVIGESQRGAIERYREHVVPVSLIRDEAISLAERGAPEQVIADFIRHHLYVVLISNEEARMLDMAVDQGGPSLKTSMPDGWVVGCDPLERLREAHITVRFYGPLPLPEWKPWKKPTMRDKVRKVLNTPLIRV